MQFCDNLKVIAPKAVQTTCLEPAVQKLVAPRGPEAADEEGGNPPKKAPAKRKAPAKKNAPAGEILRRETWEVMLAVSENTYIDCEGDALCSISSPKLEPVERRCSMQPVVIC